ncbi:helix-turn-helix transcriptional regulator [Denitrobaculum tricleocarpae]|uniref:Transcriptional regulator n=1 Tax=Denitrobaculum tricleocarpae TaxID=2591009 RepID=A0A545TRF1_9PROT|nr:metalloregulator ArsR/SmtB family transcription factor [Denitrobaculum tricleocarpae]TQV79701.1 transcriptional regulator [Denitrobaculum tricleocarpae]
MAEKSTKTIKTRQAILDLLKREGPQSAQALAKAFSITPMAVRQHLYDLYDQKLVSQDDTARPAKDVGPKDAGPKDAGPRDAGEEDGTAKAPKTGPKPQASAGRPVKRWRLTPAADSLFPDRHADLAVELIASIRETFGQDAMERLIASRSQSQLVSYRAALDGADSLEEKLTALAKARSDEGYMAEVLKDENGEYLLVENHCPICAAAKACTGICAAELSVFQDTLGPEIRLERVEHLLQGARRCAYRVSST